MCNMNTTYPIGDFPYTYTQKGWECPKCGRVYSPSTMMCFVCGNQTVKIGDSANPIPDVWKPSTICESAGTQTYGGTKLCDKHYVMFDVTTGCEQCKEERTKHDCGACTLAEKCGGQL